MTREVSQMDVKATWSCLECERIIAVRLRLAHLVVLFGRSGCCWLGKTNECSWKAPEGANEVTHFNTSFCLHGLCIRDRQSTRQVRSRT